MRQPKIIVVGGGLAGLMATIRVAEAGVPVDLFSIVPVKRSHSVCAQGGINAAKNQKGEGDTTWKHFDDTIYGGDFLANQPLVKRMCEAAPGIIDLLDRMGVMFNRTSEGLLDYRRFGGTLYHRTAFAGATTGQQLLYALDEQVRRHEAEEVDPRDTGPVGTDDGHGNKPRRVGIGHDDQPGRAGRAQGNRQIVEENDRASREVIAIDRNEGYASGRAERRIDVDVDIAPADDIARGGIAGLTLMIGMEIGFGTGAHALFDPFDQNVAE